MSSYADPTYLSVADVAEILAAVLQSAADESEAFAAALEDVEDALQAVDSQRLQAAYLSLARLKQAEVRAIPPQPVDPDDPGAEQPRPLSGETHERVNTLVMRLHRLASADEDDGEQAPRKSRHD